MPTLYNRDISKHLNNRMISLVYVESPIPLPLYYLCFLKRYKININGRNGEKYKIVMLGWSYRNVNQRYFKNDNSDEILL